MMQKITSVLIGISMFSSILAQSVLPPATQQSILESVDRGRQVYKQTALQIWELAEVGYKEEKSSALLQQLLQSKGFTIEKGVAGIPTAFIASYGSGTPVIAVLAEFDALPGISQTADPVKTSAGKPAGHACGHHLFGVAAAAAGIAIKQQLESGKLKGTIRIYGCPAEEGGSGKVYLVRAGLFKDVDAAIHWHPGNSNAVTMTSALANMSAKFRFHGISAHAAAAPEKGRSALDAVESMDYMVNLMREHVPQETRIHYVITQGGKAPNVIPDFAEVYYYVRHPKRAQVQQIFNRVVKTAEAAAMGTETTVDYEMIGGTHDLLINRTLAEAMQKRLEQVGGISYTSEEEQYARKIQATLTGEIPDLKEAGKVQPLKPESEAGGGGSTDVGDVSYTVPTVGLRTATWVPGTPAHSWQAIACGGTDIGIKGMQLAAQVMALTAADLFTNPTLLEAAKSEFKKDVGAYQYKALLGDRAPALNYRD